jgi:predicted RNase H-like HicB family nuclease
LRAEALPQRRIYRVSKKDVYRFWAAFHYADDGVSVRFPDLPGCLTCGDTAEEAHAAAREALEGFLYVMEQDGDAIPDPSQLDAILTRLEDGEAACDVQVYMPTVREAMESKAVKKTLTVPKWLNDAAEQQHLNFSQVLQEGLKRNLGIETPEGK